MSDQPAEPIVTEQSPKEEESPDDITPHNEAPESEEVSKGEVEGNKEDEAIEQEV